MAEAATPTALAPSIASHIKRDADGKPYLQGSHCGACGHTFVGERSVCAKCFVRDKMSAVRMLEHDWFPEPLPENVIFGERSWCYSSFAFAHYRLERTILFN